MAIDSLSQSNDKSECDALQKRLKKEIENKRKKLIMDTEKLKNLTDDNNKSTSSFVQNILFEDSEAGVTVLDLFVAIKKAKDKINVLTKNNNDIDKKLNSLKNEVGHMKTRWIQLTEDFINFFQVKFFLAMTSSILKIDPNVYRLVKFNFRQQFFVCYC